MFTDQYPRFLSTSSVAANAHRLNLRHEAIFRENRSLFDGKRVLDIASHDGRWTLAAIDAGASHVVGVEARPDLVASARSALAEYDVDSTRFELVEADVFEYLLQPAEFDVVLCLGFLYHTLRYGELLSGIRSTGASHVIVDSRTIPIARQHVRLLVDRTEKQGHAVDDPFGAEGVVLTGTPSRPALRRMFEVYGYALVHEVDWDRLARQYGADHVGQYLRGRRVTWTFERM